MTQEQKHLLLVDLCARLSSMVRVKVDDEYMDGIHVLRGYEFGYFVVEGNHYDIDEVTPYLRPMSSMTEEEREEFSDYLREQVMPNKIGITIPPNPTQGKGIPFIWMDNCLNWLNKKGFDYRGLIPMGLALEAPEDMYK